MYYSEAEARQLVVEAGHRLLENGLIARTWGNISARISDTHFIITPSGLAYETMKPEQLVKVAIADGSFEGMQKPSSEKGIHAAVYRLQPETGFVIHTHQTYASGVGVAGKSLTGQNNSILGDVVPCGDYGMPSTKKLCRAVTAAVAQHPGCRAVLMMRHGALCMGTDREQAFRVAEELEKVCQAIYDRTVVVPERPVRSISAAGAVLREDSAAVLAVAAQGRAMRPYLGDLAQSGGATVRCTDDWQRGLSGRNAVLVPGVGAYCTGEDAQAVAMILKKGAMAELYAQAVGGCEPLGRLDAALMRQVYLHKYSKRRANG